MTTINLNLQLPDPLAREAEKEGLLTPQAIESMLRREVQRRKAAEYLRQTEPLTQDGTPVMTSDELDIEIAAARAERRSRDADRR